MATLSIHSERIRVSIEGKNFILPEGVSALWPGDCVTLPNGCVYVVKTNLKFVLSTDPADLRGTRVYTLEEA